MRQSQKSNRSRGRGGRKGGGGGGGGGGNNMNRVYDSAGPEGKVRGTPQQIIDKYLTLARDAQTSGDRVTAENFLQHAEHYQRILISAMSEQERARREATVHATDEDDDESGGGMDYGEPYQGGVARQREPERRPASEEIDGMATIDAGAEPVELVVADDEMAKSQPRGNGNGGGARRSRRRPPKQDGEGEAALATTGEGDAQATGTSEG